MKADKKVSITFLAKESVALDRLTYVVIGAREDNGWIFVRHRDRDTWELPAGHIEENESAMEAAHRELFEETGTRKAEMQVLTDYAVTIGEKQEFGRIFFAVVLERGPLPDSEIGENRTWKESPLPATYPEAHEAFLGLLNEFVGQSF